MPTETTYTFINGKIFTSNPDQLYASAMVIKNGRIAWIGEQADLSHHKDAIDLQGKRILPGLIDAHLHPLFLANTTKQIPCTPPSIYSIKELVEHIREHAANHNADEWIQSWGYDEGKLKEGRAPVRQDLDRAAKDIPVIVTRTCSHIIAVNSAALAAAGITRDTPNPPGGQIDKDENGEPTGILRETARDLVEAMKPQPSLEESASALANLNPHLLGHGITAITELMARTKPHDYFEMYQKAREKGLAPRTVLYYLWEDLEEQPNIDEKKKDRENAIHTGGVKLFADGSVSGQTAWVHTPYLGENENHGIPTTTKEQLLAAGKAAENNNVQLVIHAMGDQAIDFIIDTFYEKKGWLPDAPSIRIEHAAMPSEEAIKRAAKSGIAFVPQPIFLYAEIESYLNNLGSERTKEAYPIQSMLQEGIPLAFSSDAPATAWADPVNPFVGIKAAVTRKAYDGTDTGQDQRIDVQTAIALYTRDAQKITRIPEVGQLKEGFHADFIVLNEDILEINPEKIDDVKVKETYISGELVYQEKEKP